MSKETIIIGTRGSQLALWQANWVKSQLISHHPGLSVELEIIKTSGDKILDVPLAKVGGKGLFVKEIEEALIDGRVHLAVHSMKDMPGVMPGGLHIAAVPVREVPYDVLISNTADSLEKLPEGAVIGTSSLRRASQLLYFRPDFVIKPLRGNIDTRIRKLTTENLDGVILAAAGVKRLEYGDRITAHIDPDIMLPAVGQGALCIEARQNDPKIAELLSPLHHPETACRVAAERAFLKRLEGGCQVPIAAFATVSGNQINIAGMVAEIDGTIMYREEMTGPADEPETLGRTLAERLIEQGGGDIVQRLIEESQQT